MIPIYCGCGSKKKWGVKKICRHCGMRYDTRYWENNVTICCTNQESHLNDASERMIGLTFEPGAFDPDDPVCTGHRVHVANIERRNFIVVH